MERLTRWNGKKWVLPQGAWREITERLAAYENTGLEPAEIELVTKYAMSLKYGKEIFKNGSKC